MFYFWITQADQVAQKKSEVGLSSMSMFSVPSGKVGFQFYGSGASEQKEERFYGIGLGYGCFEDLCEEIVFPQLWQRLNNGPYFRPICEAQLSDAIGFFTFKYTPKPMAGSSVYFELSKIGETGENPSQHLTKSTTELVFTKSAQYVSWADIVDPAERAYFEKEAPRWIDNAKTGNLGPFNSVPR